MGLKVERLSASYKFQNLCIPAQRSGDSTILNSLPQLRRIILRQRHYSLGGTIPQEICLLHTVDESIVQNPTVRIQVYELLCWPVIKVQGQPPRQCPAVVFHGITVLRTCAWCLRRSSAREEIVEQTEGVVPFQ